MYSISEIEEGVELIATWEWEARNKVLVEGVLRSKTELKVLPNRLVVFQKNERGLWDLYAPIIETDHHYVREHRYITKVISNISTYDVLDNYLLYQVVPVGERPYWQCISLKEDRLPTTVWNRKFEKLVAKRMEEIPKIYESEVEFDRSFNEKYKYESHLCMLKASNKTIVVETEKADLGGDLPISISYFEGKVKYLSTKHFSISNGNESYVYPFEGKFKPIFGPYGNVVDIGEHLMYGLPKNFLIEGWAGVNLQNKVEQIYFKVKDLPKERDFSIQFPAPVAHILIRKHDTSKEEVYVISVRYKCDADSDWQEIFDMEGIRFHI